MSTPNHQDDSRKVPKGILKKRKQASVRVKSDSDIILNESNKTDGHDEEEIRDISGGLTNKRADDDVVVDDDDVAESKARCAKKIYEDSAEVFYFLWKLLIAMMVVLICLLSFVVYLYFKSLPADYMPSPYSLPPPPRLEGELEVNYKLERATKFLEGLIVGPEFIIIKDDHLYTGTANGSVVEINDRGGIRVITNLGKPPCGMEFDADGFLIVCDAYLGIFKVDIVTGHSQLIVSPEPALQSSLSPSSSSSSVRRTNFINDLELDDDGNVYYTDSSVFERRDFVLDVLLLRYNAMTNRVEVLKGNLDFPNGILLSKYGDYILISETSRARILKYYLKGIHLRQTYTFVDNLPCLPDNLQRTDRGTILVACGNLRYDQKRFNFVDFLQEKIWLRALLMKLPIKPILGLIPHGSMLMEFSESGKVLKTMMDLQGATISHPSHAVEGRLGELGRKIFIGSYVNNYIGVIDL
ncbi:hypothetical protein HELRODRAFT_181856 [Helobdella robusta]|uniref:Strictosidine synthase conserved region domain-containing protein n=1 Tax=Helobdella robusta TaxID=6412 RepID=T1FHE6_HELRO|nr:hypothetical protein HELRODRAFT_181856 [Helobdella robusta]ESN92076.1 hypothetical protein HELRODRAFT_181856 [Helobdella robusta]